MKETIVKLWCDRHASEDSNVEATTTRTITIDGFPARSLDVCEQCDKELFDQLIALVDARGEAKPTRPAGNSDVFTCEICGDELIRHSMVQHVRGKHLKGQYRYPDSTCSVCGVEIEHRNGLITHMTKAHGFDLLADSYRQYWEANR